MKASFIIGSVSIPARWGCASKRIIAAALMSLLCFVLARADAVSDWNAIANTAALASGIPSQQAELEQVFVHIAIYDAVNAIDGRYTQFAVTPSGVDHSASQPAAAAAAAYTILSNYNPTQKHFLDSAYAAYLTTLPDNDAKTKGIAIGTETAQKLIAARTGDGWAANVPYTFLTPGPGVYQRTPGGPATPIAPWIAVLKPFALDSPSQFRAPGPPALTSAPWARDFNETKMYGAHDSFLRTTFQTEIGLFYTENPATWTSRNLRAIAAAHGFSIADNARFFAQMYVSIADAFIAGWDSKYYYNFWRPVTAIRNADIDGNPATEQDTSWLPLAVTPGHPEYPAAHGFVTGALVYAMENFFGTNKMDVVLSSTAVTGTPMVEHHFTNTDSIIAEVINARVYGGMHYRTSAKDGAALGKKVADWVAAHYFLKASSQAIPTAGLQLWLRADTGLVLNGTQVSDWIDQSGQGHNAVQHTASRQPQYISNGLNGKPVVHFDGIDDKLGFTGSDTIRQMSLFMVFKHHSGNFIATFGAANHLTAGEQLFLAAGYNNEQDRMDMGFSTEQDLIARGQDMALPDKWRYVSIVTDHSLFNSTVHWNGMNATLIHSFADGTYNFTLGDSTGSGGGLGGADGIPDKNIETNCDFAEVIVYNTVLSDSVRMAIEDYLTKKYDLAPPVIPSAGLQLWLKADYGVGLGGTKAAYWSDQSGLQNNAVQPDTARQPQFVPSALNGRPAVHFDGINDRLGFTGSNRMTQFTMFIVTRLDSGTADQHFYYPIELGDNAGWYGLSMRNNYSNDSPDEIDPFVGENSWVRARVPGAAEFDKWKITSVTVDQKMWNTNLWSNGIKAVITPLGVENVSMSVSLGNATGTAFGGLGEIEGVPIGYLIARFDVAEVLVYNTVLSDTARKTVESYLNTKYNVLAKITSVADRGSVPGTFALLQNYPNPFNPSTIIKYQIAKSTHVTLKIYDMLGRMVRTLVNEDLEPGSYEKTFDARGLSSGVYLYRLQAGSFVETKKLMLLR